MPQKRDSSPRRTRRRRGRRQTSQVHNRASHRVREEEHPVANDTAQYALAPGSTSTPTSDATGTNVYHPNHAGLEELSVPLSHLGLAPNVGAPEDAGDLSGTEHNHHHNATYPSQYLPQVDEGGSATQQSLPASGHSRDRNPSAEVEYIGTWAPYASSDCRASHGRGADQNTYQQSLMDGYDLNLLHSQGGSGENFRMLGSSQDQSPWEYEVQDNMDRDQGSDTGATGVGTPDVHRNSEYSGHGRYLSRG